MPLGPFDLTGGPFLQLYGGLLVMTIIIALLIPRWLRPEGRAPRRLDTDHLAYLAGGRPRLAETVAARLLAGRQLVMIGRRRFQPVRPDGATPAERSVLALRNEFGWSRIEQAVGRHAGSIRDRLVDDDLMIGRWDEMQLRLFQTLPFTLLIGFGYAKLLIGEARGRPVGYLTTLLIITALLALVRFVMVDGRTRAGQELVAERRRRSDRLRRAPAAGEQDVAVALFGTAVLAGSELDTFHQLRASSGGGDSGSSSDGGGGGCGGGGCGGCGG